MKGVGALGGCSLFVDFSNGHFRAKNSNIRAKPLDFRASAGENIRARCLCMCVSMYVFV